MTPAPSVSIPCLITIGFVIDGWISRSQRPPRIRGTGKEIPPHANASEHSAPDCLSTLKLDQISSGPLARPRSLRGRQRWDLGLVPHRNRAKQSERPRLLRPSFASLFAQIKPSK
jgi:hypothetical protein